MMFIIMFETFIKIDSLQHLRDESSLRTDQISALQHSLFWRYANFSKLEIKLKPLEMVIFFVLHIKSNV